MLSIFHYITKFKAKFLFSFLTILSFSLQAAEDSTCPVITLPTEPEVIKNEPGVEFVDHEVSYKDISTGFVVNEFFTSKDAAYNFMEKVFTTVDQKIKNYTDANNLDPSSVSFLFKGGNVIRLYARKFISMLPKPVSEILWENYKDFFKRSDADYTILIDKNKLGDKVTFAKVLHDLTELSYEALNEIRTEFHANKEKYFDFFRLSKDEGSNVLRSYLDKFNANDSRYDPDNFKWYRRELSEIQLLDRSSNPNNICEYIGALDYRFEKSAENESQGTVLNLPSSTMDFPKSAWIKNTINTTLEWPIEGTKANQIVKFNLVRAKVQFLVKRKRVEDAAPEFKFVPGELIDISLVSQKDPSLELILEDFDGHITTINLKEDASTSARSFAMRTESPKAVIHDIQNILFEERARPWHARKYEKRINRLFFLFLTDIANEYGIGSEKTNGYFQEIRQSILNPINGFFTLSDEEKNELARTIPANLEDIKSDHPHVSGFNGFLEHLSHMLTNGLVANPLSEDEKKLPEFFKVVFENLNLFESLKLTDAEQETFRIKLDKSGRDFIVEDHLL